MAIPRVIIFLLVILAINLIIEWQSLQTLKFFTILKVAHGLVVVCSIWQASHCVLPEPIPFSYPQYHSKPPLSPASILPFLTHGLAPLTFCIYFLSVGV